MKPSERIAALQVVGQLEQQLRQELVSEGIDPDQAALVEDDSCWEEGQEVPETGHLDENGEMRRPWCAATRMLDHREQVRGGGGKGGVHGSGVAGWLRKANAHFLLCHTVTVTNPVRQAGNVSVQLGPVLQWPKHGCHQAKGMHTQWMVGRVGGASLAGVCHGAGS